MENLKLHLVVMSGVDDGTLYISTANAGDGKVSGDSWLITIGRLESCDIRLNSDSYVSRHHASLHWRENQWWLEDRKSRNGTFIAKEDDFFEDIRVHGIIPISVGQLFRIGRTWLCIQPSN